MDFEAWSISRGSTGQPCDREIVFGLYALEAAIDRKKTIEDDRNRRGFFAIGAKECSCAQSHWWAAYCSLQLNDQPQRVEIGFAIGRGLQPEYTTVASEVKHDYEAMRGENCIVKAILVLFRPS